MAYACIFSIKFRYLIRDFNNFNNYRVMTVLVCTVCDGILFIFLQK